MMNSYVERTIIHVNKKKAKVVEIQLACFQGQTQSKSYVSNYRFDEHNW